MSPADGGLLYRNPHAGPKLSTGLKLHLGMLVQPYRNGGLTTYDVAQILEAKYGLMATFYRVNQDVIAVSVAKSLEGATETLLMGGRPSNPWGPVTQFVQREFKDFISSQRAEQVGIPGTPTKAALRGVNHRKKHPYSKRNPRRPSFKDTGLMMGSFRAWVE